MIMKYKKNLLSLCVLTITLIPSLSMAYSLGSDNRPPIVVINPPLGRASVPETQILQPTVIDIGYGWSRTFQNDGSSVITHSQNFNNDIGFSQQTDTATGDGVDASSNGDRLSQYSEMPPILDAPTNSSAPGIPSAQTATSTTKASSVNYFLPAGTKKSKTQVKCQTRYDPVAGKWVVRYLVVFAMNPKSAKVQKITRNGAIAYVNIDKKGRGIDVIP